MSYLTLAQLKTELGITGSQYDAMLKRSLSLADTIMNGYIGWSPTDILTQHVYTTAADACVRSLQLPLWPVIEVVSVESNGVVLEGPLQNPEAGFWVDNTHGRIEELSYIGGRGGRLATNRVTVRYRAGYDPVPRDLYDVALNIASAIYANGGEVPSSTSTGSGELKSLTMFDAMSMSFDVGSNTGDNEGGAAGMVGTWSFVLDKYKRTGLTVLK